MAPVSGNGVHAAVAVEDRLFRAVAVLRWVVLANAVGLALYRGVDNYDHPTAGYVLVAVMVAWTTFATWAYADRARRGQLLLYCDLGLTLALIALTPLVKGPWFNATIPGFWVMAALFAWAIRFRTPGGFVAGVLIGGADLLLRDELTQTNYSNFFLLMIGGPIVGFMCGSLQQMAAERDEAQRTAAAATERARLARVVHDGVLQVLALVQRRGAEIGGPAADLGRLAGEQESALRTLIRSQDAVSDAGTAGTVDLASRLGRLSLRPGVDVAVPGGPVELPSAAAAEVVAVVAACLDNVTAHVGEGAPAWVLLEAFPDRVEVSVRDEGPGIPAGRLEEAAAAGRLGVSESIRGRVADLGGTAQLSTGSYGTEWELVVPR
ncbi:histidine kinase [Nocardioides dongxiaopingii]|nr:histidine kinase [Nocardioides sp. S-1144]